MSKHFLALFSSLPAGTAPSCNTVNRYPGRMQLIAAGLLLCIATASNTVQSAELLMIEEPGCIYCDRFNREIAPAYPNTLEGKSAPLRRIQLAEPWPKDLEAVKPARFTPTFILVDQGREIDRLAGYPGDEYFWFLLGQMLDKL